MLEIINSSDNAQYTMGGISFLVLDVNFYSRGLKIFCSTITYLALGSVSLQGRRPRSRGKKAGILFVNLINANNKNIEVESGSYSR